MHLNNFYDCPIYTKNAFSLKTLSIDRVIDDTPLLLANNIFLLKFSTVSEMWSYLYFCIYMPEKIGKEIVIEFYRPQQLNSDEQYL